MLTWNAKNAVKKHPRITDRYHQNITISNNYKQTNKTMNKQVLRILELCLKLKEEKGYDIFFEWHPHCDQISIRHSENFKWNYETDVHFYWQKVYLDHPKSEKKLDAIITHLEKL